MQRIFKRQQYECEAWDALTCVRSSSVLTVNRRAVVTFSRALTWSLTPCTAAVTCCHHLQNFQWEHKYLSVFPQWRDELRALQLAVLTQPASTSCIMHHHRSIMVPTYLIIENHVTCSTPTMRNWIFFITSNCSCNWFPRRSHVSLWTTSNTWIWQSWWFACKFTAPAWAELISKEPVLLQCFPQWIIVEQPCAQGRLWLSETVAVDPPAVASPSSLERRLFAH